MTTLYEGAFAKLNLTLDVLGKRPDGYHDLKSVMQAISIRDDVEIDMGTGKPWTLECGTPGIPEDSTNLAWKAAQVFCNAMNKDPGGIAIRIINLAKVITGRTPGALAQTNVLANMLFGAISGSGTAAASAMGSIIGPIEREEGYDPAFSAAANIATAPTGLLIPPSNVMITFALVSGGTSVAALFMAGYIPGILWGLACMAVIFVIAKK